MSSSCSPSPSCDVGSMRCIAHLDMDCFYAQVEAVRLGVDCRTTPLVLSQWDCLIAVNYPARKYGITRGKHTAQDARELCPGVIVALSPSYRVGESVSAYHPHPTRDRYKISLEPYRHASRQIFAILSAEPGVAVEKAGVDEAFLDVTEAAQRELAVLRAAAGDGAVLDPLADVLAPSTRLIADRRAEMQAWCAQRGTSLAAVFDEPVAALLCGAAGRAVEGSRGFCVDAADAGYAARCLLLCAASRVVLRLRQRIYAELHYDCSAGIAHNRVLAKCISATHKPNQQTLLLPDRSASALFDLSIHKIRGFGGKFGAAVSAVCGGAADCRELWLTPLSQLYALDGSAVAIDDDGGCGGGEDYEGHKQDEHDGGSGRGGGSGGIRLRKPYTGASSPNNGDGSDLVRHDTSLFAFYRMRGVAGDAIVNRPLSKSLIASKQFGRHTSSVEVLHQWVVVLCGELCSRYEEFTSLYRLRGRSWNIKLGNEGFRRMGGVMNYTVPLPEAVQPDILAAVTLRELQALFRHTPNTVADSVTLTIAGFVSDNTGAAGGAMPSLAAVAGGRRAGHHGPPPPPRQQTLSAFFTSAQRPPSHTPHTTEDAAVVCSSSSSSSSSVCASDSGEVDDGGSSDVVALSLPSQHRSSTGDVQACDAPHSEAPPSPSSVALLLASPSQRGKSPLLHEMRTPHHSPPDSAGVSLWTPEWSAESRRQRLDATPLKKEEKLLGTHSQGGDAKAAMACTGAAMSSAAVAGLRVSSAMTIGDSSSDMDEDEDGDDGLGAVVLLSSDDGPAAKRAKEERETVVID